MAEKEDGGACQQKDEDHDVLPGLSFDPPVYKQRYEAVSKVANHRGAKEVLDIGCAELKLLLHLRDVCPQVEQLYGVDIDHDLLECKKFLLEPLITDHLFKRPTPLSIAIYHGSIDQPDSQEKFFEVDLLTMIEIIEHLHENCLQRVPEAVFGCLKPKCAIVTTPNSDFNVLFDNFTGFRHWDHKFEWSRAEFEMWANDIATRYSYSVTFSGIGEGPPGSEDLGCCSQMALFERFNDVGLTTNCPDLDIERKHSAYTKISEIIYPHAIDKSSLRDKIIAETNYVINTHCQDYIHENQDVGCHGDSSESTLDEDTLVLPLSYLLGFHGIKTLCDDNMELFKSTVQGEFQLSEDASLLLAPRLRSSVSSSCSEASDNETDDCQSTVVYDRVPDDDGECWD